MKFFECFTIDIYSRTGKKYSKRKLIEKLIFDPGYRAVVYYRISRYLKNIKFLGGFAYLISRLIITRLTRVPGVEILTQFEIGEGLSVYHPHDIVIGKGTRIGKNVTIYQGVGIGERFLEELHNEDEFDKYYPTIGNGVTLFTGAKIIGPVEIGDNSIVGANSVVNRSFPPNSIIAGAPARFIRSRE